MTTLTKVTITKVTTLITGLAMAAGLVLAAPAHAAAPVPTRVKKQDARIANGVRTGKISPRKARRLRASNRKVSRVARRARATGKMTPRMHRTLEHKLNTNSKKIYKAKH